MSESENKNDDRTYVEQFTPTDLMTLRNELLQSGVDSFQAAEIVTNFSAVVATASPITRPAPPRPASKFPAAPRNTSSASSNASPSRCSCSTFIA